MPGYSYLYFLFFAFTQIMPASVFAAPSPRMLVEISDLSDISVSPDGLKVAFRQDTASVINNRYEINWFVGSIDGKVAPTRISDGGDRITISSGWPIIEPPQWSLDSKWIYYRASHNGQVEVWRASCEGGIVEQVTFDRGDVISFWLDSSKNLLNYSSGPPRDEIYSAEEREYDVGVEIDGSISIGQGLVRSGLINGRLSTQRFSGKWMALKGLLASKDPKSYVVDLNSKVLTEVKKFHGSVISGLISSGSGVGSGNLSFRITSMLSGKVATLTRNSSGMEMRVGYDSTSNFLSCDAYPCKSAGISAFAWRGNREQIIFSVVDYKSSFSQYLYSWDIRKNKVKIIFRSKGLVGGGRDRGSSCSISDLYAVCVESTVNDPPKIININLDSGKSKVLFNPNNTSIYSASVAAKSINWVDNHGVTFSGQFYPSSKKMGRSPLFITYYACLGYDRGGVGDEWPLSILSSHGIASLCINEPPEGSSNSSQIKRYELANSGIKSIINILYKKGVIDLNRIGMGGLSFGSEIVMWEAMKSNYIAVGSVSSPSVSPAYYLFHSIQGQGFRKELKDRWGLEDPVRGGDDSNIRWKEISPFYNLDKINIPILFQMPEQEYMQSFDYFSSLVNLEKPVDMFVFPNEPHIKILPRHKLAVYERNLDWFRFWLQDYVDRDDRKNIQYKKWEDLRSRSNIKK